MNLTIYANNNYFHTYIQYFNYITVPRETTTTNKTYNVEKQGDGFRGAGMKRNETPKTTCSRRGGKRKKKMQM